jgi:hypothetical protein
MPLSNTTRNQHFLSQIEQRLNSIDRSLPTDRQSIYEFEVLDRGEIRLSPPKSQRIGNNLSMLDLFSFDVDKPFRQNLEALFRRYEDDMNAHTEALLNKLAQGECAVSDEVVNLYAAKLLNFARNPYSVPKILDTFGIFGSCTPTYPATRKLFIAVRNGRRKHQKHLCKQLGITNTQYEQWLRMLFTMLMELKPGFPPLFDQVVQSVFTSKEFAIAVLVSTYDEPKCLLSDRGFSTNIASDRGYGFDFNLCARAFIRYFVRDRMPMNVPSWIPKEAVDHVINSDLPVQLCRAHNDMNLLRSFNMNVINQCHSRVFCATDKDLVF